MALLKILPTIVAIVYGDIRLSGEVRRLDSVLDLTSYCRSINATMEQEQAWPQSHGYSILLQSTPKLLSRAIDAEFAGLHHVPLGPAVIVVGDKSSVYTCYGCVHATDIGSDCTKLKFTVSKQVTNKSVPQWLRAHTASNQAMKEMADIADQQLVAIAAGYAVSKVELRKPAEIEPAEVLAEPVLIRRKRTITTIEEVC